MSKGKRIIVTARWVVKGAPYLPGDLVAERVIDGKRRRLRVAAPGAMGGTADDEIMLAEIPVPA